MFIELLCDKENIETQYQKYRANATKSKPFLEDALLFFNFAVDLIGLFNSCLIKK